jgi:carboxylesterase
MTPAEPDARPFLFEGDRGAERGVLCIHGFTGTPFEMRGLGERLAQRGFTAAGPLLPGHGGGVAELNATTWRDWVAAMAAELTALRHRCRRVAIVGLSLGGLISLRLAARDPELPALAVLSVPLWLPFPATAGVLALGALSAYRGSRLESLPKGGPDVRDPAARRGSPSLRAWPLLAAGSVLDFMPRVRAGLSRVRVPTLVMHADHDHVAAPACARELHARLGATDKRLVTLPRSYHVVTVDVERELVAREVGDFLDERMA